ncbi:hypothetical protein [Mesorhizobium sp. YR577]|uniref:hypothetical protein n=1 Tax=Mesorhizobium sp. YR577 TaxID=1884373 RepID=UPI0008E4C5A2|nr:hypothetical protein [Mesorhizobium sp. YR577]SFU22981.1 hypothetical protein SAMN05518861_14413 [Mesorhizobium sp. YR577]
MSALQQFKLSGTALPKDARGMLDEICEHFIEHAEVQRTDDLVLLKSDVGTTDTQASLQLSRNIIGKHLFYFAGEDRASEKRRCGEYPR